MMGAASPWPWDSNPQPLANPLPILPQTPYRVQNKPIIDDHAEVGLGEHQSPLSVPLLVEAQTLPVHASIGVEPDPRLRTRTLGVAPLFKGLRLEPQGRCTLFLPYVERQKGHVLSIRSHEERVRKVPHVSTRNVSYNCETVELWREGTIWKNPCDPGEKSLSATLDLLPDKRRTELRLQQVRGE